MKNPNDNPADPFKKALAEATHQFWRSILS